MPTGPSCCAVKSAPALGPRPRSLPAAAAGWPQPEHSKATAAGLLRDTWPLTGSSGRGLALASRTPLGARCGPRLSRVAGPPASALPPWGPDQLRGRGSPGVLPVTGVSPHAFLTHSIPSWRQLHREPGLTRFHRVNSIKFTMACN